MKYLQYVYTQKDKDFEMSRQVIASNSEAAKSRFVHNQGKRKIFLKTNCRLPVQEQAAFFIRVPSTQENSTIQTEFGSRDLIQSRTKLSRGITVLARWLVLWLDISRRIGFEKIRIR